MKLSPDGIGNMNGRKEELETQRRMKKRKTETEHHQ